MSLARALSPAIREIRLLCCQTGAASAGTRSVVVLRDVPTVQALTEPTATQAVYTLGLSSA